MERKCYHMPPFKLFFFGLKGELRGSILYKSEWKTLITKDSTILSKSKPCYLLTLRPTVARKEAKSHNRKQSSNINSTKETTQKQTKIHRSY